MMSRMLGAPLGGTMRGGHQVFDPSRVSLITPPNFGSGAGSRFPLTVVVELGKPGTPVICWACTVLTGNHHTIVSNAPRAMLRRACGFVVILLISFCVSSVAPRIQFAQSQWECIWDFSPTPEGPTCEGRDENFSVMEGTLAL